MHFEEKATEREKGEKKKIVFLLKKSAESFKESGKKKRGRSKQEK